MTKFFQSIVLAAGMAVSVVASAQIPVKQMVTVAEKQQDFSASQINVDAQFCKVSFVQSESDKVTFTGKMEAMAESDEYKINIAEEGDAVKITVDTPTDAKSSYAGEMAIGLTTNAVVVLNTTSGNVSITDINGCNLNITTVKGRVVIKNTNGTIKAETKNGDITVTKFDGTLAASTSAGKVSITDSKGSLTFDTSDGAATATNIEGTLNAKTIAGTQTYDNIQGDLNIQGGTGAIKLSNSTVKLTANNKGATINLFKVTGEFHINSERGQIVSSSSANGITLTASSDFTTTEGKINLTLINKKEELSFDLEHAQKGDIGLIAKGQRTTKKQLKFGNGPIVITGRTNTGTQTYK